MSSLPTKPWNWVDPMKHELANIYRELAAGRLNQDQALQQIRRLRQGRAQGSSSAAVLEPSGREPPDREQPHREQPAREACALDVQAETLLAQPQWQALSEPPAANPRTYSTHTVLLCGFDQAAVTKLRVALPKAQCLHLPDAEGEHAALAFERWTLAAVQGAQDLLRQTPQAPCLLQIVIAEAEAACFGAGLAGLLESAGLENPLLHGQVLCVPATLQPQALALAVLEQARQPQRRLLKLHDGAWFGRDWQLQPVEDTAAQAVPYRESGVYLISGGLGGLGRQFASELLAHAGELTLVLCGRSELDPPRQAALQALARPGAQLVYRRCEIADPAAVQALVQGIVTEFGRLDGVLHIAGELQDEFLLRKTQVQARRVLASKVTGTRNLDAATASLDLDFFVLFSSIASWAGNLGQADYAAANGFMEQFAGWRQAQVVGGARRGRSLAIAWPHWADGGMHIDAASLRRLEQRTGLRSLPSAAALAAFRAALAADIPHLMVVHGPRAELNQALQRCGRNPAPAAAVALSSAAASGTQATTASSSTASNSELLSHTSEWLRQQFSELLKIPAARIDSSAPLEQYGIDSILAMDLTSQLETHFGSLAKTLFFEYQTLDALAEFLLRTQRPRLLQILAPAAPSPASRSVVAQAPVSTSVPAPRRRARQRFVQAQAMSEQSSTAGGSAAAIGAAAEPIAIIGLSGRYPCSPDLQAFWENLREGRDCIVEVPPERWPWREHYSEDRSAPGRHYSRWGGFIEGADEFDPRFFNIAPREAAAIDPQERVFLQHAWLAIEDAGYSRAALQLPEADGLPGQVGVYVGVMYGEYNLSGSLAGIANRVSHCLNLHGPSLSLDTMCSSSLTAIHLACQDLRSGRTRMALAGGVNLSVHPNKYTMLSAGQFISGDGHCQSFGEGGDGYIPGEGVGVAVLKRLSDALRDGDPIHGLIRASAINHGGKTNGYTVPNPQAQAEVIRRALREAGVEARAVSYVEAHGTGTKLGDPIEIAALTRAFEASGPPGRHGDCLIGSAKSNIGHCESAAGIAGLSKILLQLRHGSIVPSLHSRVLNPHIDFAATPFVVCQQLQSWQPPLLDGRAQPRIAGLSSFGAGGSNAHLLIEEYRADTPAARLQGAHLFPLSARTSDALQARAADLLTWIEDGRAGSDLLAIAWTLQVGREPMDERLALVASDSEQLAQLLRAYLQGEQPVGLWRGRARSRLQQAEAPISSVEELSAWMQAGALDRLAAAWVVGQSIDWPALHAPHALPRRISLPGYAFARERYWQAPAAALMEAPARLHPLLHRNCSDLDGLRFESRFDAGESVLERAGDEVRLPPLLLLEMALAALAAARPNEGIEAWELHDLRWGAAVELRGLALDTLLLPVDQGGLDIEIGLDAERVLWQGRARPLADQIGRVALSTVIASLPPLSDSECEALGVVGLRRCHRLGRQWCAELQLPAAVGPGVHALPMLQAVSSLLPAIGQAVEPLALRSLSVQKRCPQTVWLWLRPGSSGLDIDLCDAEGDICLALQGLQLQSAPAQIPQGTASPRIKGDMPAVDALPLERAAQSAERAPAVVAAPVKVSAPIHALPLRLAEIALIDSAILRVAPPALTDPSTPQPKPSSSIGLGSLNAAVVISDEAVAAKPRIRLPEPWDAGIEDSYGRVELPLRLFEHAQGIYVVELAALPVGQLLPALQAALRQLQGSSAVSVLLLQAPASGLHGDREDVDALLSSGLLTDLITLPCAVLAALPGDATGAGLLLAAACDFMLCAEHGEYAYADYRSGLLPTSAEQAFFGARLGASTAFDLLFARPRWRGKALPALGWNCPVLPAAALVPAALRWAGQLAHKPEQSLRLLKAHVSQPLLQPLAQLSTAEGFAYACAPSAGEHSRDVDDQSFQAPASCVLMRLGDGASGNDLAALVADLRFVIERLGDGAPYSALVLSSDLPAFLPLETATESLSTPALLLELAELLRTCPVPVIAAFEADAGSTGWLCGLFCDFALYSIDGQYSASALWTQPALADAVAQACEQALGAAFGLELRLCGLSLSGAELACRARSVHALPATEVLSQALHLAERFESMPRAQGLALKRAWAQQRDEQRRALSAAASELPAECAKPSVAVGEVGRSLISSAVLSAELDVDGVALIKMHDRAERNLFSPALVQALQQAFEVVAAEPACRVVVLTGYDSFFATGGTRDTLLAIQQGRASFTDETVFQLPMDCPVPVLAALQGHAIGGGLSFGLFADLHLLSAESRYLSPYMGYGFTPGAGSTLLLPARLGLDLARESLFGAQEISGQALRERGCAVPVLPRAELLPAALACARRIAELPRQRLIALKQAWRHSLLQARPDIYRRELKMHAQTFVGNEDTLQRIRSRFEPSAALPSEPSSLPESADAAAQPVSPPVALSTTQLDSPAPQAAPTLTKVLVDIRGMLAQELFLQPDEIEAQTPFIDLGLDSITGVTWIRRINAEYGTDIEATRVYSHPTLQSLAELVAAEAAAQVGATAAGSSPAPAVQSAAVAVAVSVVTPNSMPSPARTPAPRTVPAAAELIARLRTLLAEELHLAPDEIDADAQFIDLGLDSITGVTWVRRINADYGTDIEATRVYSHASLSAMAQLLRQELASAPIADSPAAPPRPTPTAAPVAPSATGFDASTTRVVQSAAPVASPTPAPISPASPLSSWRARRGRAPAAPVPAPIAIIGSAGRFARARDLETFWAHLAGGVDCVDEVAAERWSLQRWYQAGAPAPGKTNSRWLGALPEYDCFDPLFFSISPTEAECMEPQQRVFLETCWHAIENAGRAPQSLSSSQCGVFVGCGPSDYLHAAPEQFSAQGFTGTATSILAARIAYVLNLRGPCVSIDTACSSSLVAIANACDSLNAGSSDLALAGGVYVMAGPGMHVMTAQAGMLSTDGRCHSFDQRANGFVPGEGVGVLLLKRLADAQRDGDSIQAVIEAWGINQDGKTNGITAPNEEAQTRLLQSVYRRFAIKPDELQLIEAHGTGTKLGDPIEVAGLKAAFKPHTTRSGYCALGSVKSNIGHCLTAAGVAGVLKIVLAMKHRMLPPSLHYQHCNEHIRLDGSPFYVNDRLRPWTVESGQRRRAAVSSFGFSGTNAHLVLAEPPVAAPRAATSLRRDPAGRLPMPLSARTEAQLRQRVGDLLAWLRSADASLRIEELACSLQLGRDSMDERLVFMVSTLDELRQALQDWLGQGSATIETLRGQTRRHREELKLIAQDAEMRATLVEKWLSQGQLSKLMGLWAKGMEFDFGLLYGTERPLRLALPGYPFARERYWLGREPDAPCLPANSGESLPSPPSGEPQPGPQPNCFLPCWQVEPAASVPVTLGKRALIVSTGSIDFAQTLYSELLRLGWTAVDLVEATQLADFSTLLMGLDLNTAIDCLFFLALDSEPVRFDAESVQRAQECNAILLLRLLQALKRESRIAARVETWVLSLDLYPQAGAQARYWGAGASGLAYALAQGSHAHRVRNIDLSTSDLQDPQARQALLHAICTEPASDRGEVVKLSAGKRLLQGFRPLVWDASAASALRHAGVYVIVGGSGIVGRIITRHLRQKYAAQVVWIGRSAADAPRIRAALHTLDGLPGCLSYEQADALDAAALGAAVARIRQRHPQLHGALFSGMVFAAEGLVEQVEEADFREVLEVKTRGIQAFHHVFADAGLDFLCHFSSGQAYAFSGAARLPAYASGIVAADAYARAVASSADCPVGIINWGFWRAAVNERVEKLDGVSTRSLDALEDAEGFACLEHFLGELQRGRLQQLLCMRASSEVAALMRDGSGESVALAPCSPSVAMGDLLHTVAPPREHIENLLGAQSRRGLEGWFARLLAQQIGSLIAEAGIGLPVGLDTLRRACGVVERHANWFHYSLDLLAEAGLAHVEGPRLLSLQLEARNTLITAWQAHRTSLHAERDVNALIELSEECLRRLPEILRGRMTATDVLFPQGCMDRVGALYRDNAVADTFNELVAATVARYVEARLQQQPLARLRILEIGAGTGGTSAAVFRQLQPYRDSIDQYCYTDLSKAFFLHAQDRFLPDNPYLTCQRLDIEQELQPQGLQLGSFDLVLATNVLHATRDIRTTLRHAKSALRGGGYLIVNEMCKRSLATHLSFGLLDGWWLFEDPELRIPGCPGLFPETWQRVLAELGFGPVWLPAREAHALGNQVLVAASDGLLTQRRTVTASSAAEPLPGPPTAVRKPQTPVVARPQTDLPSWIHEVILDCLARTLKLRVETIDPGMAFSDYGVDSILGVGFVDQVNARLGLSLNTAIIFEYASIDRLSAHLAEQHATAIAAAAAPAQRKLQDAPIAKVPATPPAPVAPMPMRGSIASATATSHACEIAIIGMSGQFPKATNVREFWHNLANGIDAVEELPPHYLNLATGYSPVKQRGRTRCRWGGILADRDCFDPLFFSISPKEAEAMNPHQRLVMQESWNALEDAAYDPRALAGSQTAIYVGAEPSGYVGDSFTGLSDAIIASRLSYALDFKGAAFVVNTGCSSSAVAIHLGCESLRAGESDLVLAGGVNACLHQNVLVRLDQIEMLSPSGRCHTFDRSGDGTLISEGVGMLVLKRLPEAITDGDHIHGLLCASGMNQDGASNGITAPSGAAQEQLIDSVYARYGIDARQISYVEAHGTGTRLGDPVETNALVRAFRRHSADTGWCVVGSAKSHLGHAAAAAGVIGIIKVLLSMRHRHLPRLLNFRELNPLIEFADSPFQIPEHAREWTSPAGVPRMAAVNSFGHSGTNVHLVLREHLLPPRKEDSARRQAIPLSARTAEQLRQRVEDLLARLAEQPESIDLGDLAFTLQCGRESMEHRLGLAVSRLDELMQGLRDWLAGTEPAALHQGQAGKQRARISASADAPANELLAQWAQGHTLDWSALWRGRHPRRIALPGYPFAKERYWAASAFGSPDTVMAPIPAPAEPVDGDQALDEILQRVVDEAIAPAEGARLLRALV
ncbi:SDR family NAD(P)-dependent oxidoreductase [Aquimonas sp.]|jgi:acyl transferase domain-containing protein/enoyl-CoA hydratase/carnithine racemase/acyl carrier protein/NAD(P)-dependent dehydrogenase (short-subunit alcohol dehydrogenase family)|uniref:SDR family NAD(P)-dependent oxidoreductase n=1 Tax=Aquimonas sp. TaxID=1872588 RepID=UPI0037C0CFDC